ncbi:CPBP family intramembrane glutamic endopeptidase [Lactococcus petauri]|uniref:CPBP family intramembrane glutamic endopeptidase n=1 Tax=Lactococcus petauri TaxID=1940789 RepID=UPI003853C37F
MEVKSKEIIKALIGFGLFYIGFYLMGSVNLHIGLFQELTLLVFSLLAAALIFKNSALEWFRKPEGKYLKIIILCFFANVIWSFIGGALVQIIFGLAGNHGNEAIGNLALLPFVPFMLMGEELFSITLLETFRKKFAWPTWISTLLTAFIFGMVHFQTYFGGDVLRTIVQILLVQGAARLIFNYAYLKTKSIWTSWIVHLIFDIVMLTVPLFFTEIVS